MKTLPTHTALNQFRQVSDPLADNAIAELVAESGPEEARSIFDKLIKEISLPKEQLPPSFQSYWEATNQLPDWVDPGQISIAQNFFIDHGAKFLVFLYFKSLPLLYSCADGAQVLIQTGRLTQKGREEAVFTRRIAETGRFLVDIMAVDGLKAGGIGIQAIQKVRLIHAAIRFFVKNASWDTARLGVPINQEDMAGTLMTFSIALTDGLEQFDIHESKDKIEAYIHLWKAVGQNLGIQPALLPDNADQSRSLLELVLKRHSKASEAGKKLTQALIQFVEDRLPGFADPIAKWLVLHLCGRDVTEKLGLQPPLGCLGLSFPLILRTLFKAEESLEEKLKQPLQPFLDYLGRQWAEALVAYFDKRGERQFRVPNI